MASRIGEWWQPTGSGEAAEELARLLEEAIRRELAERAETLRRLEAAARCGALFAGSEGASWGRA